MQLLQLMPAAHFLAESFCIPCRCAQSMSLGIVPVVSWWAACITPGAAATAQRGLGMIILSPYNLTGLMADSSNLTLECSLVSCGQLSLLS